MEQASVFDTYDILVHVVRLPWEGVTVEVGKVLGSMFTRIREIKICEYALSNVLSPPESSN